MKKIAVLGNSHVAALKSAWDESQARWPGYELTFFAHRKTGLAGLRLEGRRLVPDNAELAAALRHTSGGHAEIAVDHYDGFVLYGLELRPFFWDKRRFISQQVKVSLIQDSVEQTLLFKLLLQLETITEKPILIGPMPLVAAQQVVDRKRAARYVDGIQFTHEQVFNGAQRRFVPQPQETVVNGRQTDPQFSIGSKRLAIGRGGDNTLHVNDRRHMNTAYGTLWLSALFAEADNLVEW